MRKSSTFRPRKRKQRSLRKWSDWE